MSKEDLRSKFEDSFDAHSHASEGGMGPDVTDWRGMWRSFEPAILEYAKQQAIAFMNWTLSGECDTYNCTDEDQWTNIYTNENITTERLYNIFIEQSNKEQ